MSHRILIIEDDASIREGLCDTLRAKGYTVSATGDGQSGWAAFSQAPPDLVLLDLMLPDTEGFEVCKKIKGSPHGDVGVIILTARGAELDRVRGLELGADDYVTKPFSLLELMARISAVLRRRRPSNEQDPPGKELQGIHFGDVRVDFRKHEGTKGGRPLALSDRGYLILQVFARHRGEVISREQLLEEAWGYGRGVNTRTVDNHVVKLRQQLEDDPEEPRYILTVHGIGYKLAV